MKNSISFILICTVLICTMPATSFGGYTSILKSDDPREPQVIVFKEDPSSKDSIIYTFCPSEKASKEKPDTCETLGSAKKDLLFRSKIADESMKTIMTYFQPIAFIATIIITGYVAIQTGVGPTFAFFAGSGSYLLTDLIYSDDADPKWLSELSTVTNPKATGRFILPSGISILDFSYRLEERLNSMEKYEYDYGLPLNYRPYYPHEKGAPTYEPKSRYFDPS